MNPVEISELAKGARPWLQAIVIGPPPGHEANIGSLPALVGNEPDENGCLWPVIRFAYQPSEDELKRLNEGEPIWIELNSPQMFPISVSVGVV